MKNVIKAALIAFIITTTAALGGAIKTWSTGDTLTASDLNSALQHIHNVMVGGHGARLINTDVSATAAISESKINNGHGIAKAWVRIATTCSGSPCTVNVGQNVSGVTRSGAGSYVATLSYTATDANFAVLANSELSTVTSCIAVASTTTTFTIYCVDAAGTLTDARFSAVVFDDN